MEKPQKRREVGVTDEVFPLIPTRWGVEWQLAQWWRIGLWVHVDLRAPMISFCLFWLMFGFGRVVDRKRWEQIASVTKVAKAEGGEGTIGRIRRCENCEAEHAKTVCGEAMHPELRLPCEAVEAKGERKE